MPSLYRVYPSKDQKRLIKAHFGACRFVYEPIPKATLLLIIGNSQNYFHDHELD
ncbi:helix-turn-helix domain-containing protein [Methanosarcina barkeri]|uniref:helix-turn-helix domain-containing protein n=1 Tax=Methanosarcina barkeri TaxID=2208 RepID=UPI0009B6D58D